MPKRAEERGDEITIVDDERFVTTMPVLRRRRLANGIRVCQAMHHGVPMAVAYRLDGSLVCGGAVSIDGAARAAERLLSGDTDLVGMVRQSDAIAIAFLAMTAPMVRRPA